MDEDVLSEHLARIEAFLWKRTSFGDQRLYKSCGGDTYEALHTMLEKEGLEAAEDPEGRSRTPVDFGKRVDIFNMADIIFRFFIPPHREDLPTVKRFWGAIKYLVRVS